MRSLLNGGQSLDLRGVAIVRGQTRASATTDERGAPSWAESIAWAVGIAILLYLAAILMPNLSWGVYANL